MDEFHSYRGYYIHLCIGKRSQRFAFVRTTNVFPYGPALYMTPYHRGRGAEKLALGDAVHWIKTHCIERETEHESTNT